MRRTSCVFVLAAGFSAALFCGGLNAQIPENTQFQPGSYALPYHAVPQSVQLSVASDADATLANGEDMDDSSQTEWEKKFSPQVMAPASAVPLPVQEVPHLTFVYSHWTHRFHVVPYEPGYAANPAAFPVQTSPLHVWVSSSSSASQPSPQVQYMSYYDPDPVILPAEIRLRGSRFAAPLTQLQPMPLPVPRPETAQFLSPPARTRLGERFRQNFGAFSVK